MFESTRKRVRVRAWRGRRDAPTVVAMTSRAPAPAARVLLTGFEPFGGDVHNPSTAAARDAVGILADRGVTAEAVELPCAFGAAGPALTAALDRVRPEVAIAVGLAGGTAAVRVERVAVNLQDARIPDNAGDQPVDRPVRFRLTSDTVMQSFMIRSLGSQIYAMAGMVTELNLLADRPAVLMGQNTQFNGFGFQAQKFQALAMPPESFAGWIADARAGDRPLDEAAYGVVSQTGTLADLRSRYTFDPARGLIFSSVQPDLFSSVVARYSPDAAHRHASDETPAHTNGEHAHADH